MSELVRITVRDEDDLRVVAIAGEVDVSNVEEVRAATLEGLSNTTFGLVLDMRQLSYLDSAGVAFVFEVADRLGRRAQAVALVVSPSAVIRRALEVTEVDAIAPIVPTLEAARRHVLPDGDQQTA